MNDEDINKLVREHLGPGDGFGILCTHKDGVKLVRAALEAQKPVLFPFTIDVRRILGKPNFACAHIAERMRTVMRHNIPRKAEEEQAAVIYFCLGHYLKHGAEWAVHADAELNGDKT
jgi:hypothetical protein